MPHKGYLLFLFTLIMTAQLAGQSGSYPRHYFRNPLDLPMELTANFGELRSDHWHMGLDIRTNQKENQPVYAAAAGYISHVGIRPQSFGRYIIIDHPNGLSTLYAHLNDFYPELERYVTAQQYKQESWAVELDLEKNRFPVRQGHFIAYSGNTGGSQGPHLHFEIRDTKTGKCLNPLLFAFPIADEVSPTLVKLALYDRNKSIYDQSPQLFNLKKTDTGYIIPKLEILTARTSRISFAIQAYDRLSGSTNPNGIYEADLFLDDQFVSGFKIDSISYDESLYINSHIDYKHSSNGGSDLQHLSKLTGAARVVYKNDNLFIELSDTLPHGIRIEVLDPMGNKSVLNFQVRYNDAFEAKGSPQGQQFVPNQVNVFDRDEIEVYLPETCLYDSLRYYYYQKESYSNGAISDLHQLQDASIPVHGEISARIKLNQAIPDEWKDKLIMRRTSGRSSIRKADWQDGWAMAKFNDLGSFQVFADIVPPAINVPGKIKDDTLDLSPTTSIIFRPTDNFEVIKNFRAEINGKWERFTNDKGRSWIFRFPQDFPYGNHHLKVTVEDLAGNTTVKEWWFKKHPYTPPPKKKTSRKKAVKKRNSRESRVKSQESGVKSRESIGNGQLKAPSGRN